MALDSTVSNDSKNGVAYSIPCFELSLEDFLYSYHAVQKVDELLPMNPMPSKNGCMVSNG